MILTLIVVLVTLSSMAGLALVVVNAEASAAVKVVMKRHGFAGLPLGCLLPVFGFTSVGLWTWYAISVSDWRFAAIVWIPLVCNLIGKAATYRSRSAA